MGEGQFIFLNQLTRVCMLLLFDYFLLYLMSKVINVFLFVINVNGLKARGEEEL